MEKTAFLGLVTIIFTCCVHEGCIACSNGYNEVEEVILRANVTFSCISSWRCDEEILWDKRIGTNVVPYSGRRRQVDDFRSYLDISGISVNDDGRYTCRCVRKGQETQEICSVTLNTICQATVLLNRETTVYNSSSTPTHVLNVNAGERIKIACPEYATPGTNCINIQLKASRKYTYNFDVLSEHHSCHIQCLFSNVDEDSCSVNFTLNVLEESTQSSTTSTTVSTTSSHSSVNGNALTVTSSSNIPPAPTTVVTVSSQPSVKQGTSTIIANDRSIISATAHARIPVVQKEEKDKSGSFPVMLLVGIPIVVLVGILFIICFFMYFSRSKSTSRQKKTQNLGNESPDTNIPIGPTYATINKSSPGGDEDSAERGIPCTDDAYDEVSRDVKREPTQHDNAVKAEISITKDYYSVVNTSNTKLESKDSGSKSDSALSTEVNKEVKQAGANVNATSPESSGCNPSVPDVSSDPPYDVLEQPESSEYDAVGVVSTSSALYAVVEKERKEE